MRRFGHFWIATLIRGIVAIVFGCAAVLVPDLAAAFLLRPLAVAIAVLFLAAYGVLDSTIVSITSFIIPPGSGRIALRTQGVVGLALGLILFFAAYDRVRIHWYLYLVAMQAASLALSDFFVAQHVSKKHGSNAAYMTGVVASIAAAVYLFVGGYYGDNLPVAVASWMIFLYLLAFGLSQSVLAARMLYQEVSEAHELREAKVIVTESASI